MTKKQKSTALYTHPFSKAYWRDAAGEMKDLKILVFAALMIAIRVAMKGLSIPLAPGLKVNTAFLANALGAMVFGPVVAAVSAVVSDVLGYLMWPQDGVYFLPFILTEVAGSVFFALFLYRAKVTPTRVMLSRFCICFLVNVVLQTPIYIWYYSIYVPGSSYVLTIPGIIKNLFMFPIESVVLTLFLSVMLPITNRMGLTYGVGSKRGEFMRFSGKQKALLVLLVVLGAGSVVGYLGYHYESNSVTKWYTAQECVDMNKTMYKAVAQQSDEWDDVNTLTVIEYAKKPLFSKTTTYTVAIYTAEEDFQLTEKMWGYKKTPASKDENLTRVATATIVLDNSSGEVVSFEAVPVK